VPGALCSEQSDVVEGEEMRTSTNCFFGVADRLHGSRAAQQQDSVVSCGVEVDLLRLSFTASAVCCSDRCLLEHCDALAVRSELDAEVVDAVHLLRGELSALPLLSTCGRLLDAHLPCLPCCRLLRPRIRSALAMSA
jgi:hypothetical protein